jgi:mannose-6-phosphate isomerase-like protein (cupin superfamily)
VSSSVDAPQADGDPGAHVHQLDFEIAGATHTACIDTLIVAGWAGRDLAAVEQHIAELAAVGVKRPGTVPCFYPLGANLLTQDSAIDVAGVHSSGEVEVVLVSLASGLHVGVGSDHTDRRVEAYDVAVAKQMCPKPISRQLWRFGDVEDHWDDLILRSWVTRDGRREPYQDERVARMLSARELMERYLGRPGILPVGTTMYCGTVTVNGAIRGGERFEVELEDSRLGRKLEHAYLARCLEAGPDEARGGQMAIHKDHKEFHTIDLGHGWEVLPGYPAGIEQQILAGSLDEKNKTGFRTRHLRFKPGVYTTLPFTHDYWEEVYVVSGDLVVGSDANGAGGKKFGPNTYACRPPGTPHGPFRSDNGCLLLELHYYDAQ